MGYLLCDINQLGIGKKTKCKAKRLLTIADWCIPGNKKRDASLIFLFINDVIIKKSQNIHTPLILYLLKMGFKVF